MPKSTLIRPHKRCWLILTAGLWPWKSESAKECVTTHVLNQLALKMDGTQVSHLYLAVGTSAKFRQVGGLGGRDAAFGSSQGEMASGSDLGGSSKYSNENFED